LADLLNETMITIYSNVSQDSQSVKGLIGSNKIVDAALKASIVSRKSENVEKTQPLYPPL